MTGSGKCAHMCSGMRQHGWPSGRDAWRNELVTETARWRLEKRQSRRRGAARWWPGTDAVGSVAQTRRPRGCEQPGATWPRGRSTVMGDGRAPRGGSHREQTPPRGGREGRRGACAEGLPGSEGEAGGPSGDSASVRVRCGQARGRPGAHRQAGGSWHPESPLGHKHRVTLKSRGLSGLG